MESNLKHQILYLRLKLTKLREIICFNNIIENDDGDIDKKWVLQYIAWFTASRQALEVARGNLADTCQKKHCFRLAENKDCFWLAENENCLWPFDFLKIMDFLQLTAIPMSSTQWVRLIQHWKYLFCIFNCIPWLLNVFLLEIGPQIVQKYFLEKLKDNQSLEQAVPYQGPNHCIIYQHHKPILVSAPKCVNPYRPYNPQTIYIRHKFNHCLFMSVTHWVSFCSFFILFKLDLSKLLNVILLLLNRFVNIDTWISLSCYRNLSKLIV